MNSGQFRVLADEFIGEEQEIMNLKACDYTDNSDRLKNFKQVSEFLGQRPSEIALTYLMKHVQRNGEEV